MNLNQYIEVANGLAKPETQASLAQDNAKLTDFALKMMERLPRQQPAPVDPPKIPSLGALAIPN